MEGDSLRGWVLKISCSMAGDSLEISIWKVSIEEIKGSVSCVDDKCLEQIRMWRRQLCQRGGEDLLIRCEGIFVQFSVTYMS
jgi:hypothetical protein